MIISNSTPLIHLGKIGKLNLLFKCFGKVLIPEEVCTEILALPESIEAVLLEEAIREGWIKTEKNNALPELLKQFSWLDEGELQAISLAIREKKALLIDDKIAKQVAQIFKVKTRGTLFVLLRACQGELITHQEAVGSVNAMIKNGFYLSSEVYSLFLEMMKEK